MDHKSYHRGSDGQGLLLHELLTELENASDDESIIPEVITIVPPQEDANAETDQDSDESDAEATGDFQHLPRRLLLAECSTNRYVDVAEHHEENLPGPATKRRKKVSKPNPVQQKKWSESETSKFAIPEYQKAYSPSAECYLKEVVKNAADALKVFFNNELLELIVEQTNLYAGQKGRHNLCVTKEEILVAVGIMLYSGYHTLPSKRMYWKTDIDCHSPLVTNAMRRNRFDDILKYLHFADNSEIDGTDSFYKVWPIFQILNNAFKVFNIENNCSIDESIIPYYGHHGAKQFIRGKPIRFGFKLWSLANPTGLLHHAEPYCGKDTHLPQTVHGQGGNVVIGLAEHASLPQGTKLFFDNLFTSIGLLEELSRRSYGGTGTLRLNRVSKQMKLSDKNKFAKQPRGTSESRTADDQLVVRWNDNAVVTVLTNCIPLEPASLASRYSRTEKKKVEINMPGPIAEYNKNMGGVDLSDQFLATYRTKIRIKKWWWPFFSLAIDVSCVQGWLLYRRMGAAMPLLEFRRQCCIYLLTTYGNEPKRPGIRPSPSLGHSSILEDIRSDGSNHIIIKGDAKYRRCKVCGGRTCYQCKKCTIALHPQNCFATFHK